MTNIHLNLNNCFDFKALLELFPKSDKYEFTSKKVFRLKERITCECGGEMMHNGYDYARKNGFGKVKIGKQICPQCGHQYHEEKSFWKNLLKQWQETMMSLTMLLRDSNVAWETISKVMGLLIPCGKDKLRHLFNIRMEQFDYPQDNFLIVNYDEQHPKKGRIQQFRLTILNYKTKVPIADGLFANKNKETIEAFLRKHLDANKEIVIITDCYKGYPSIFKKIWGNKVIHQKCLFHLNKLVVGDFGRNITLLNEYLKYEILNIFYNRKKELRFLKKYLQKQNKKVFSTKSEKQKWERKVKKEFREYVKKLENERRREGKNLTQRKLKQAEEIFEQLFFQRKLYSKKVQERIEMIKKNWKYLTAFYAVKDCPATNNAIENFYSTSLKTHRKKQFRSDRGINNQMKLSALKRSEGFRKSEKTFLEIYRMINLIT